MATIRCPSCTRPTTVTDARPPAGFTRPHCGALVEAMLAAFDPGGAPAG